MSGTAFGGAIHTDFGNSTSGTFTNSAFTGNAAYVYRASGAVDSALGGVSNGHGISF